MSIRLLRLPFKHITNTSTLARPSIIKRTMASSNNNTNTNEPSMIGGHAQYAKGYVEETIGNVTGNKEWTESGKKDSKEGIESMKVCPSMSSVTLPLGRIKWMRDMVLCSTY